MTQIRLLRTAPDSALGSLLSDRVEQRGDTLTLGLPAVIGLSANAPVVFTFQPVAGEPPLRVVVVSQESGLRVTVDGAAVRLRRRATDASLEFEFLGVGGRTLVERRP